MTAFLTVALTFLKTPWGRGLSIALAALILASSLYLKGSHDGKARELQAEASREAQARKAVARREVKAAAITHDVGQKLEAEHVRIEYRTKTLIERIPVASDPSRASLPNWFVSLHDSAVTGLSEAPGSANSPDVTPSGVTDNEAARVVIGNVGVCHQYEARLAAWESWYGQLRATYNGG